MAYDPIMASPDSPLGAALARVGDRWSLLVVEALLPGPRRFNELTEAVTGIAPNILADRLRRLEAERVIRSTPRASSSSAMRTSWVLPTRSETVSMQAVFTDRSAPIVNSTAAPPSRRAGGAPPVIGRSMRPRRTRSDISRTA